MGFFYVRITHIPNLPKMLGGHGGGQTALRIRSTHLALMAIIWLDADLGKDSSLPLKHSHLSILIPFCRL